MREMAGKISVKVLIAVLIIILIGAVMYLLEHIGRAVLVEANEDEW